jgi:predicted dienelactone hydrolase
MKNILYLTRKIVLISLITCILLYSSAGKIVVLKNNKFFPSETFEIKRLNVTFNSSGYRLYGEIYYPNNSSSKYPVVIFCIGQLGYVSAYRWIPIEIAKQGYVTMIFDPPGLGHSEGIFPNWNLSIDFLNLYLRYWTFIETPIQYYLGNWRKALNDAIQFLLQKEDLQEIIDKDKIGLVGHSLGGITVTEVAAQGNYNFSAVVAISLVSSFVVDNIDTPLMIQSGDLDLAPIVPLLTYKSYNLVNPPRELIMIQSATHFGFTTAWGPLCPAPSWQKEICIHYTINWLNYFIKGHKDAYKNITKAVPHLSKLFPSKYNFGDGDHILT